MASEYVINEKDMGINVSQGWKSSTKNVKNASFLIELVKHIDAGVHSSGFLAKVYCFFFFTGRIKVSETLKFGRWVLANLICTLIRCNRWDRKLQLPRI